MSRRKSIPHWGVWVLVFGVAAGCQSAFAGETGTSRRLVKREAVAEKKLDGIEMMVRAGQHEGAAKKLRLLLLDLTEETQPGASAAPYARAIALAALVAAAEGRADEARWAWWTAANLSPESVRFDLAPFGAAARIFGSAPPLLQPSPTSAAPNGNDPPGPPAGLVPPAFLNPRRLPGFTAAMERLKLLSPVLRVEITIDAEGRPKDPVLHNTLHPAIDYAVLEALGTWRFRPATLDGEPLTVRLAFDFRFKNPHASTKDDSFRDMVMLRVLANAPIRP